MLSNRIWAVPSREQHRIDSSEGASERCVVFETPLNYLGPLEPGEGRGMAHESTDFCTTSDQCLKRLESDLPGCAGDKNHCVHSSIEWAETVVPVAMHDGAATDQDRGI
jgi:hypothetical protein